MRSGPNVVITGASDGIGFRLAKLYAGESDNVVGIGRRDAARLPRDWPENVRYFQGDQASPEFPIKLGEFLQGLGWRHIDHLILNAGIGKSIEPPRETAENICLTVQCNLLGTLAVAHRLHAMLKSAPGRPCLTFTGSTAHKGAPSFASYAASKAGLNGMARALAQEWRDDIDVQILHPGPTATAMHRKAGLKLRFTGMFFINPDYSARKMKNLIDQRVHRANIGYTARGLDRLKSLFGAGI